MSHLTEQFDYEGDPQDVHIDFSQAHVWDHSGVVAIAKVVLKYQQHHKQVEILGLNEESKQIVERIGLAAPSGH